MELLAPRKRIPRFRFNGDAQARAHFLRYKIKLIHGGFGSGKSVLHHLAYIEEAQRGHTDQIHALFTHTNTQLVDGILPLMEKGLRRAGVQIIYDHEPPPSWFRRWDKAGIRIPFLPKYRGIATLSLGVHVMCGTFHHQSFKQFHSVDVRTLRIDEFFEASKAAVQELIPRCRCGDADDWDDEELEAAFEELDEEPDCGHLHDVTLLGNPPLGSHWVYEWLDRRQQAAKKYHDGSAVDDQNWDLLRRGVGTMIMVRVPTHDNVRNVGRAYIEELESGFSNDVAVRYLDGEIRREAAGRAFKQYSSSHNVAPVPYDPNRTVYVLLDFDLAPRAAVFFHLLERGEYPDQGKDDKGITHFGVFGEFFSEQEMSNRDFVLALIRGHRGSGGDCEYPNPVLRGLPRNWTGLQDHRAAVIFSGDARGRDKSRQANDLSGDWQTVRNVIHELELDSRCSFDIPEKNPDPGVRIHTLDGKFSNMHDVRAVHLDPITKHLQRDAEICEWDEAGHDLRHCGRGFGGTLWMRTHLIAALGYGVCRIEPMGTEKRDALAEAEAQLGHFESTRKPRRTYPGRT